jgi:ubiquitin C-terminal hydrolase
MKLNFILYMIAHPRIMYLMLSAIPREYSHLAAVVQKAAASPGKSPLEIVTTGPVNVYNVIGRLSWFGFFKHLAILVEIGAHKSLVSAFFCEVFSWHGSRRVDVYTFILRSVGCQVDTTLPPGWEAPKPEGELPRRIADMMARVDRKMYAAQPASLASPVPPKFVGSELPADIPDPLAEDSPADVPDPQLEEPPAIEFAVIDSPPQGVGDAKITALECAKPYEVSERCIIFGGKNGEQIAVPCIDGVLDFSEFSDLTELKISNCPAVVGIKLPPQIDKITIDGCKNLSGDIDLSECANIAHVNICGAGKFRILTPHEDGPSSFHVENCQSPEIIIPGRNHRLSIEFVGCKFSQEILAKMARLRSRCSVTGLPDPEPVAPPQVRRPAVGNPFAIGRANPVGIPNVGNSCYAGSLMQLMFQNKQFREAVAELCTIIPPNNNYQKLLHSINAIFMHLQSGTGSCPPELMEDFMKIGVTLGYVVANRQDDSAILRTNVLDNLGKLFTGEKSIKILALRDKLLPVIREQRIIESFATDAGHRVVYESTMDGLQSEIEISPNGGSLEVGLEQRYGSMELTGSDRYELDDGTKVDARTGVKITGDLPQTLTVKIGRISTGPDGKLRKNTNPCTFPEYIDMRAHMENPSEEPLRYKLNSVIVHIGGTDGGHYMAYVNRNGKWFKCSDSQVEMVSWSKVEESFTGRNGSLATAVSYERCST